MLLYLDYVLGPGSLSLPACWSLFGVYRTGDTVAVLSIIAKTPPTKSFGLMGRVLAVVDHNAAVSPVSKI